MKKNYVWDNELGPLHYKPYAGGSLFPNNETITIKPGFKIWVDGGVMDYDESICLSKRLDCSATCCLQSYCAPDLETCVHYIRGNFNDLYIGFLVVLMIVVGIPTCIGIFEFFLNFKFCKHYDEEADAQVGGMTFCECLTYIFTCGKSMQIKEIVEDEYILKYKQIHE